MLDKHREEISIAILDAELGIFDLPSGSSFQKWFISSHPDE
jgi:hypothetical protein